MYTEATDAGPTAESGPAEDSLTEAADSPQQKSQQQEQADKTAPHAKYIIMWKMLRDTLCFFLYRSSQKKGAISEKKKIPKSTFDMTKSTTQPSQKWKSLGLTDEKFYTAPQSPLKTASRFVYMAV